MPSQSFFKSPAQGLPACATATEPDRSSAANTTKPDRMPATLDFSKEIQKCVSEYISESPASVHAHGKLTMLQRDRGCEAFCAMCSMKNDRLALGVSSELFASLWPHVGDFRFAPHSRPVNVRWISSARAKGGLRAP